MDGAFDLPLDIPCRPSRRVAILGLAMHAGALAGVWLAGPALPMRVGLAAALAISCALSWRRFALECARPPARVRLDARNAWHIVQPDGVVEEMTLVPMTFVHPWLIVLRFSLAGGRRRAFVLTPDNAHPDALRRLRVRLRIPSRDPDGGRGGTMR